MPKDGLKNHMPFEQSGMLVKNRVYKTNFFQRSDLWHPSYLKWESYYLNNYGVGDGSRDVNQKECSVYQMICDEQISDYCIWNVRALLC